MRTWLTAGAVAIFVAVLFGWVTQAHADGGRDQHTPVGGDKKKETKLKEPTAAQKKIAKAIASGHAYEKHVVEEKLFPEVKSESDFVELIAKVLANPTHHRELESEREAFYDSKSNTIVIYNPRARDKGTCFRPRAGLKYYENLK
jgi:pyocin large subunit-like protein